MSSLLVHVKKAKGLAAKDRNGLSDPYIILSVNGAGEQKTKIIKKTLDPVFDECFVFEGDKLTGDDDTLKLTVYDYDFGQKDDFMGQIELSLSPLHALVAEKWYRLEHAENETAKQQKEEVRGRVLVRLAYISGCRKTIVSHIGSSSTVTSGAEEPDTDIHENLRQLEDRGEKLKGVGDKSQQLNDDAMNMKSMTSSLKKSLEDKNKGILGVFKN